MRQGEAWGRVMVQMMTLLIAVMGMVVGAMSAEAQYDGHPVGDGTCLDRAGGGQCCEGGGCITCTGSNGNVQSQYCNTGGECDGSSGYAMDTNGDGVLDSCVPLMM